MSRNPRCPYDPIGPRVLEKRANGRKQDANHWNVEDLKVRRVAFPSRWKSRFKAKQRKCTVRSLSSCLSISPGFSSLFVLAKKRIANSTILDHADGERTKENLATRSAVDKKQGKREINTHRYWQTFRLIVPLPDGFSPEVLPSKRSFAWYVNSLPSFETSRALCR